MSSDLDDQWLYGDSVEVSSPTKVKDQPAVVIEENGDGTTERAQTPTLDDMEVALDAPSLPTVSKIISTAPDLQPKQPQEDNSLLLDEENAVEEVEAEGELDEEGGDSESDEDDVQITIGEITTAPGSYNRTPSYSRMPIGAGGAGGVAGMGKKVDVDAIPQIGGQSLLEFDLDEAAAERPWRLPGADIADYFNYGFTEDTWKLYCEKQRKMRGEINQLNKIVVRRSGRSTYSMEQKIVSQVTPITTISIPPLPPNMMPPGFLPPSIHPPPFMPRPPVLVGQPPPLDQFPDISQPLESNKSPQDEILGGSSGIGHRFTTPPPAPDNASDGRTTPGVDIPPSSSKPPLLPPPIIPPGPSMAHGGLRPPPPPPFGVPPPGFPGLPPGQDNIAAAMAAAMFGGGIRPPDSIHNVPPPHMMPNMPQFHPPPFAGGRDPGGMPPPPFPGLPPNFPMSMGDHGPMLDERSLGIPPDILSGRLMGQGFPWDPSMGQPPQEFLDVLAHHNDRRPSRSRSRASSFSRSRSRSSSLDDRPKKKRDRRHRRHSRSRSRSYEREHRHRSSRHHRNGDYHRSDRHERDRERERDRDRERERDSRRRREHREDKSRHERSSRRHRSISRGRDEERERERSSRKEKSKPADQELSRDCRSRSKTP